MNPYYRCIWRSIPKIKQDHPNWVQHYYWTHSNLQLDQLDQAERNKLQLKHPQLRSITLVKLEKLMQAKNSCPSSTILVELGHPCPSSIIIAQVLSCGFVQPFFLFSPLFVFNHPSPLKDENQFNLTLEMISCRPFISGRALSHFTMSLQGC